MRSILILAATLTSLFPANASLAESYDDNCRLSCAADRDSRNARCPSPYDSPNGEREQCLKDSQEAYDSCLKICPVPPPPPSPPPQTQPMPSGGY